MEMLHHPWIRSYQRRTSVIMPTKMVRRRSAVQGGPADGSAMPAQPDNLDNMTPEEIEKMIQKLQVRDLRSDHPDLDLRSASDLRSQIIPSQAQNGGLECRCKVACLLALDA